MAEALASTAQQGLDTFPWDVWNKNEAFFDLHFPNWSPNAEHNLKLGATTTDLAEALGIPKQNGSHSWLNDAFDKIIKEIQAGDPELYTKRLAAVTQFAYEATGPAAMKVLRCRITVPVY